MKRHALSLGLPFALALSSIACTDLPVAAVDDSGPMADAGPNHDGGIPGEDAPLRVVRLPVGTADRPVDINLPPQHDGTTRLPLFILLHGYGASGSAQDTYLGFSRAVRAAGGYSILPDGTLDATGRRFWNASESCCNFAGSSVDDDAYLISLVDRAEAAVPVDTTRIYFFGHSNGAFMAMHMACTHSDRITGIGTLAGTEAVDFTCTTITRPVSVLHLHGTADTTIQYNGGTVGAASFVGAEDVISRWATRDGCDATRTPGTPFDWDTLIAGSEATPSVYAGCDGGSAVELWTLTGSGHLPVTNGAGMRSVIDWLLARQS